VTTAESEFLARNAAYIRDLEAAGNRLVFVLDHCRAPDEGWLDAAQEAKARWMTLTRETSE
jgi:hypothetical protein